MHSCELLPSHVDRTPHQLAFVVPLPAGSCPARKATALLEKLEMDPLSAGSGGRLSIGNELQACMAASFTEGPQADGGPDNDPGKGCGGLHQRTPAAQSKDMAGHPAESGP